MNHLEASLKLFEITPAINYSAVMNVDLMANIKLRLSEAIKLCVTLGDQQLLFCYFFGSILQNSADPKWGFVCVWAFIAAFCYWLNKVLFYLYGFLKKISKEKFLIFEI